jgi:hypothetical protein
VPVSDLAEITEPATGLTRRLLAGYMVEAGKEFSFTGFSTYAVLARRTLQLADRDAWFDGLDPADREGLLAEPAGSLVRGIVGLVAEAPDFPGAWRFVRRDWTFSPAFRSVVGHRMREEVDGARLQHLIAIACGVPIGEHDDVVPPALRRER